MQYLVASATLGCWLFEKGFPLRNSVENSLRHDLRNILVGVTSALTIQLTERPLSNWALKISHKYRIGLLPMMNLSGKLESLLGILLLDYTLYLWHVLTHKNSFLWRFHEVHHEDLDLTATTAVRFHGGEMALSAFWRAAQILLLGISPSTLKKWQQLIFMEIIFHHSNWKLPLSLERFLCHFVVTPRMHAIHHSTRKEETDSNWSSGLTIWDYLHGTLRLDVPQNSIRIGVPAFGTFGDIRFIRLLKKPFLREQRSSWSQDVKEVRSSSLDEAKLAPLTPMN